MLSEHEIEIRVRYQETDGQGRVHHANFLTWFEMGRVELLRACGHNYKDFEKSGLILVVSEFQIRYFLAAEFDDLLRLRTTVLRSRGARIEHGYRLTRGTELITEATSSIACVDSRGRAARLPAWLQAPRRRSEERDLQAEE